MNEFTQVMLKITLFQFSSLIDGLLRLRKFALCSQSQCTCFVNRRSMADVLHQGKIGVTTRAVALSPQPGAAHRTALHQDWR